MYLTSACSEKYASNGEWMGSSDAEQDRIVISVVVCTHNRSACLNSCLASLAGQSVDTASYEVLVVDNNSSDNTRQVAEEFANKFSNFRLCSEQHQGLSYARNRGWEEAQGRYVAYIDDDAVAYPDWISRIADFIGRQPDAGIFGGPYDALFLVPKPAWFPPEYGVMDLGDQERSIAVGSEWISGTNMVFKKELFYLYGGFDVRLGMSGNKAAYGEEVQLFLAMHDKGNRIYYVPSVRVAHLVAEYKMSLRWLLLSGYSVGRRYELTFKVTRSLLSHAVSLARELGAALCQMLRPINIPFKRRLYYSLYRLCYEAGAVVEHVSTCTFGKKLDV